jgi:acyl-CoA reductase-like NAD-dependent aldehyde dehydrogenase
VVLTGSSDTGKAVLEALAPRLTPALMELSGEDPVFILDGADIGLAAAAIRFGVTLNAGNTCIRPRRVFADARLLDRLREELGALADRLEWTPVLSEREALRKASASPYALGATVFGETKKARALALKVKAGVVVVNDMIVPTAHPALPFGGRGASGYGVTRGAEGLLEFTTLKTVVVQRSRWLPHLQPLMPGDARMFAAFIRMLHAGAMRERVAACVEVTRALFQRGKEA